MWILLQVLCFKTPLLSLAWWLMLIIPLLKQVNCQEFEAAILGYIGDSRPA